MDMKAYKKLAEDVFLAMNDGDDIQACSLLQDFELECLEEAAERATKWLNTPVAPIKISLRKAIKNRRIT